MTQVAEPGSPRAETQGGAAVGAVHHWIGGRVVEGTSGRRGPVYDPATGRLAREVDFATADEVGAAVAAAKAAFPGWRATSLSKRTEILFRIRNLVESHRKELAAHLTAEHGKVPSDALGEIARGLENLEFATGIPTLLKGGFSEQVSTGVDVFQIRQPLGVVAGITPFNFPAMVPMWMFGNAIACGNTFVLKPSEKDPSASIFLAELLHEAGVPDGVFNVVHGDKVAVDAILAHPDIAAVSFVGSTPIARYIYETGTKNGKRVQALGGAKNHMVVLPDADIDMAADAAVSAGYGSAGERCMAIATVVAVGAVADPLVEAIKARLPKIKVGPGSDPEAEMGPLVTRQHRDKVASYLDSGAEQGATVVADGRDHPLYDESDGGFFLGVSLIDHVTTDMDAYRDEIFGPVLTVVRVDTYEEAVRLVNDNPYGNGTAIFTRDGGAARQFQFEAQAGMVGINVPIPVPVAYYSFGGWKHSLFGDLHMYGPEGIQFYTRAKIVTQRWPDPGTSKVDLGFPPDTLMVDQLAGRNGDVFIVSAARTPIGKFGGALSETPATDLGGVAIRAAMERSGLPADTPVDEVLMGQVLQAGVGQAPARQAALAAGLADTTSATTINRVCGSGLKSIMLAAAEIRAGDAEIVVAGGMENMNLAPYLLPRARFGYRLGNGTLVDATLRDGLWCAFEDCHMGTHAERVAIHDDVSREDQDAFALASHRKAIAAIDEGRFAAELAPVTIVDAKGRETVVSVDEGPRRDTSPEALARLKPVFDLPTGEDRGDATVGTVTAGNSPGITDGAAATVVLSERAVERFGLTPLARIVGYAQAEVAPKWLFLAPVQGVKRLLDRIEMPLEAFDLIEINEAFAAQTIADGRELGFDWDKVNVNGGAIALGHPIGASGARIVATLLHELDRREGRYGLATLCLGGGGSVAMAVERVAPAA